VPESQWELNWGFLGLCMWFEWGFPPFIPLTLMEEDSSNPEEGDKDWKVLGAICPGENQR